MKLYGEITKVALKGKISWAVAAQDIIQWGEKIIGADPAGIQRVGAAVSDAKQFASDAISVADSEIAQYLAPATSATELALETALAALTKGASVPFNPLISSGVDRLVAQVQNAAHVWGLEAKAKLAAGQPVVAAASDSGAGPSAVAAH